MRSGWDEPPPPAETRRPRLRTEVAVRRHVLRGRVVLTLHAPPPSRAVATIGEREWAFLEAADGSRDLEGIRIAARRSARLATPALVSEFFKALGEAGLLAEGPAELADAPAPAGGPASSGGEAAEPSSDEALDPIHTAVAAALPLVAMPGFRLACDGSGTCCRLYPTTTFLSLDVARARACCPEVLDAGHHPERAFSPVTSSHARSWEPSAVTMVDGRCAYLDDEGSCRIHANGGAELKPSGCRLFPIRYVDDGVAIRVAPAPECRCVFTSARAEAGEASLPEDAAVVEAVDDTIHVDARVTWSRARYLAWAAEVARELEAAADGVTALWDLAQGLSPDPQTLVARGEELERKLSRHNAMQTWRATTDLARRIPSWMEGAARLRHAEAPPLAGENLYLRAVAHAHAWVLDGVPLSVSLRDRALRLFIARRLRSAFAPSDLADPDPALGEPIALVEACSRAFGL